MTDPVRDPDRPHLGTQRLKRRLRVQGVEAIDLRYGAGPLVMQRRRELLDDLGGEERATASQVILVEAISRGLVMLEHLDYVLLSMRSLRTRKKDEAKPLVEQRRKLADSLARQVQILNSLPEARQAGEDAFQRRLRTWAAGREGDRKQEEGGTPLPAPGPLGSDAAVGAQTDGWEDPPADVEEDRA